MCMCMCKCKCMCMCRCTCACTCTCGSRCMCVCIYICMCVCVRVCVCVCVCVCLCVCVYVCAHACMCMGVYVCMCLYIYIPVYGCMHNMYTTKCGGCCEGFLIRSQDQEGTAGAAGGFRWTGLLRPSDFVTPARYQHPGVHSLLRAQNLQLPTPLLVGLWKKAMAGP